MISLVKQIFLNKFIIKFRNLFNLRPVPIDTVSFSNDYSLSDAFIWRTDKSYKTVFKYTDILKIYFSVEQHLNLIFYSNDGNVLKCHKIDMSEFSDSLLIDKSFMNGYHGYGFFLVFGAGNINIKSVVRNSYYVGYSYKDSPFSLVHGNIPLASKKYFSKKISMNLLGYSLKKLNYTIQLKYDKSFDKSELFVINPSHKSIKFKVNNKEYYLKSFCCLLIDVTKLGKINIISNFYYFRPMTINYNGKYIDALHN